MLSEKIQKFKRIYFAVTFVVSFGIIFAFANLLFANANNANDEVYTVSGKVFDKKSTPLQGISVNASLVKEGVDP